MAIIIKDSRPNPSCFAVLGHLVMTILTGGLWLVGLLIWVLVKNS